MVSSAGNSVFYAILRQIGGYRPWSNGQPGLCILLTVFAGFSSFLQRKKAFF